MAIIASNCVRATSTQIGPQRCRSKVGSRARITSIQSNGAFELDKGFGPLPCFLKHYAEGVATIKRLWLELEAAAGPLSRCPGVSFCRKRFSGFEMCRREAGGQLGGNAWDSASAASVRSMRKFALPSTNVPRTRVRLTSATDEGSSPLRIHYLARGARALD